jgi:hypothetical protein
MQGEEVVISLTNNFHDKGLPNEKVKNKLEQDEKISEEALRDIITLRHLHKEMDETVLEAYGWSTGSENPINLFHDFYEVDCLPENDRIRYTIHPDARKEILTRLLELNHKIHEEEVKKGLVKEKRKWKKKQDEVTGRLL